MSGANMNAGCANTDTGRMNAEAGHINLDVSRTITDAPCQNANGLQGA
jgi:glycine cleavage system protein P-like pyridoxal-binding family